MAYELPLDPEDCPMTPEWEQEREWRTAHSPSVCRVTGNR